MTTAVEAKKYTRNSPVYEAMEVDYADPANIRKLMEWAGDVIWARGFNPSTGTFSKLMLDGDHHHPLRQGEMVVRQFKNDTGTVGGFAEVGQALQTMAAAMTGKPYFYFSVNKYEFDQMYSPQEEPAQESV